MHVKNKMISQLYLFQDRIVKQSQGRGTKKVKADCERQSEIFSTILLFTNSSFVNWRSFTTDIIDFVANYKLSFTSYAELLYITSSLAGVRCRVKIIVLMRYLIIINWFQVKVRKTNPAVYEFREFRTHEEL